ncbi:Cytochrome P450 [Arachis hypogaea]|nr:Cytochrome P450 [Arachis hypogaea]
MRYPTRTIFSSNKFTINATVYRPVWKSLRRNVVQNMLSSTRLREFRTVRDKAMEKLINRLKNEAENNNGVVFIHKDARFATFCILVAMGFGLNMEEHKRRKAIENPGSDEIATTFSYLDTLFDLKVEGRKSGPLNDELVSLCSKFLNGGKDTTATAVEWGIAQLIANPEVQEKLYREIKECVGWWDLRLERERGVVAG